jgi:hypothetical protein
MANEHATTKNILEENKFKQCVFSFVILSKMCPFLSKKVRAHKSTWLQAIDFG